MSRKLIRDKVFALLNNQTTLGSRVFRSRRVPLDKNDEAEDGVILIYIEKESSNIFNDTPRQYKRTLTLSIAIVKSLNSGEVERIEDQLETISLKVEEIMGDNETLGNLVSDVIFEGYEFIDNEDGEFKEGAVKLTYSITYYIETGLNDADLVNFNKSHVEIKNGPLSDFQFDVTHPTT